MVVKAVILGAKFVQLVKIPQCTALGILCSDRRVNEAFAGQTEVRTWNFLKCNVSNRCTPSFLP